MPVYQYRDLKRGGIVELLRSIPERDLVPTDLQRITVPQRIAVMGSTLDPQQPEACVPKAFRQLEDKMSHREILRESGYTVDEVKEIWNRPD